MNDSQRSYIDKRIEDYISDVASYEKKASNYSIAAGCLFGSAVVNAAFTGDLELNGIYDELVRMIEIVTILAGTKCMSLSNYYSNMKANADFAKKQLFDKLTLDYYSKNDEIHNIKTKIITKERNIK